MKNRQKNGGRPDGMPSGRQTMLRVLSEEKPELVDPFGKCIEHFGPNSENDRPEDDASQEDVCP